VITLSSCTRNLDRAHATYILLTVKKQILSSMFLVFGAIGCAVADMKIETRMVITDRAARSDTQNPMMHRDIYYRRGMMRRKDSLGEQTSPSIFNIANFQTRSGFLNRCG